jgi:hypothetical protein
LRKLPSQAVRWLTVMITCPKGASSLSGGDDAKSLAGSALEQEWSTSIEPVVKEGGSMQLDFGDATRLLFKKIMEKGTLSNYLIARFPYAEDKLRFAEWLWATFPPPATIELHTSGQLCSCM